MTKQHSESFIWLMHTILIENCFYTLTEKSGELLLGGKRVIHFVMEWYITSKGIISILSWQVSSGRTNVDS